MFCLILKADLRKFCLRVNNMPCFGDIASTACATPFANQHVNRGRQQNNRAVRKAAPDILNSMAYPDCKLEYGSGFHASKTAICPETWRAKQEIHRFTQVNYENPQKHGDQVISTYSG